MKLSRPQSLAGQLVLILALALIAANVVALLLLNFEQNRFAREARRGLQVERIVSLLPILTSVPADMRGEIAHAASNPFSRLTVDPMPLLAHSDSNARARALLETLRETLGAPAADARISVRDGREQRRGRRSRLRHDHGPDDHGPDDHDEDDGPPPPDRGDRGGRAAPLLRLTRVEASIPLGDGTWLNVVQRRPEWGPPVVSGAVVFALLLSLVAVLIVGLAFIRRITRPLNQLAGAAARAGAGDRNARVPEAGPREIRSAAAAFNAMQARIGAFDAERARTIAAVGHDLRTPITSLRIRAEMLDDDTRDAMVRTLEEMRVMADGLLEWGRNEAETEAATTVDIAQILQGLCADVPDHTYAGPHTLAVPGRPVSLSRAFANILGNAERYAGGARVRVATAGDIAEITVTDSGPGIPQDSLESVFEPFTRLEESRSLESGGAGLGLSIARTIVRAHGGTITLANRTEGDGLVATVRLPLAASAQRRQR